MAAVFFYRSAPILFIHRQVQLLETILFVLRLFSQERSLYLSTIKMHFKRWATPEWSHDETTPLFLVLLLARKSQSYGLNGSPKNSGSCRSPS